MVRPSRNIDNKLLRAGAKLLAQSGAAGISVRKVCSLVGVSPGMFSYFFKSKDDFVYQIQQQLYQNFCRDLDAAVEGCTDPRERLATALLALAKVTHETRQLFLNLMRDGMNGEPAVTRLKEELVPTDLILITQLIRDCKKAGIIQSHHSDINILSLFLGGLVAPSLFGESVHDCLNQHIRQLGAKKQIFNEASIRERIDILMRGLS